MFKVGEKCTGIFAAKARLNREEQCFDAAKKENDKIGMGRAKRKMDGTKAYIAFISEWQPAENLAIGPALLIDQIRFPEKKEAIKSLVKQVQDAGINPINGKSVGSRGVTGIIIKYLIAKHDNKPFVREKRFVLTTANINAIKYATTVSRDNPKTVKFLESLLKV